MKRFIAAPLKIALSATLAMSLLAAPVSAGNDRSRSDGGDTAAILGALLGLATIGVLLSNKGKEDRDHGHRPRRPKPHAPHVQPVPINLQLPSQCLRSYHTQQGMRNYFSNRCFKNNFAYADQLPRRCRDTIVALNNKGTYVTRKIYHRSCLTQRGYRTKPTY
ncbi:hypothetical protein [Aliiroseovarius sp. 2305UL8-7]|uniref:hypothetical protein n=1 Tax=Aliiroseovarius conchicola TaxID=3121637 RepID=UPI003528D2DE